MHVLHLRMHTTKLDGGDNMASDDFFDFDTGFFDHVERDDYQYGPHPQDVVEEEILMEIEQEEEVI